MVETYCCIAIDIVVRLILMDMMKFVQHIYALFYNE